ADLEDEEAHAAAEHALELPVVFASGRAGKASPTQPANGEAPDAENVEQLFTLLYDVIPASRGNADASLQAHVTNADASNFLRRIGLVRIHNGRLRKGQQVAWIHHLPDGGSETKSVRISELLKTVGFDRVPADEAVAGDIVAVAGIGEIMIGDT